MFGSCLKKNAYNKFPGFTALRQRFAAAVIALGLILAVSGVQAEADPPLAPPQEDSSVYQMESVVVTGSRTPTDAPEKMAVPVQVITSKQLQEIGAVSLDQALEVMQGVELIQSPDMNAAPGVQTLRMRGMDANHVLILINFARHGDPNHAGLPEWPVYTPQNTATMHFDNECRVKPQMDKELLELLGQN
jgi:outer membrane receptor for ferrienterochelin and colicin